MHDRGGHSVPLGSVVTSADGTRISFEAFGIGTPMILVSGILADRSSLANLARELASTVTAVVYDRRGRGESGDSPHYAVAREVEDLRALAGSFGEPPILFGHSSGAGLAIEAAASGMPLRALVLYEPPYGFDDPDSRRESVEFAVLINQRLEAGDRRGAIRSFFEAMGLPPEEAGLMAGDPALQSRAMTMPYDFAVMGQIDRAGVIPFDRIRAIRLPTLVMTGALSPPFFGQIARQVAEALPLGTLQVVAGADHTASSGDVSSTVEAFVSATRL